MATNQFGYTLKQVMESRYKMPFKDAMQMLADRGLTRNNVAHEVGFSHSTVTKYALQLGVNFTNSDSFTGQKMIADQLVFDEFKRQLRNNQVNPVNILSKKWSNFDGLNGNIKNG